MNKLIIILIPIVLVGAAAGLIFGGIVKIPGLDIGKKAAVATKQYADSKDPKLAGVTKPKPKTSTSTADVPPPPPKPTIDPEQGSERLAKVWGEIDSQKLVAMLKDWKEDDLVKVFAKMDDAKVAEVISAMDPPRASKLSIAYQKQTSLLAAASVQKSN